MPHRRAKRDRRVRIVTAISYAVFVGSGLFYVFAPPISSTDFFESSIPAISWGVVFTAGGAIAVNGTLKKLPHLERLGLMLIVIAGLVLTLNQVSVMFVHPVTWTRGGGTAAYAAFTLMALALWIRLGDRVDEINTSADISQNRGGDGT